MIKHKVTRKTKSGSVTYTRGNGVKSVAPGTAAMRPSGGHAKGDEFKARKSKKQCAMKNSMTKGTMSVAKGSKKMRPSGGH